MNDALVMSVDRAMNDVAGIILADDGVRVTTHCMYPSNGLIRVTVRGSADTIVAYDEGEAVGEALSAGITIRNPDSLLRFLVGSQGLRINNGVIHTRQMPIGDVRSAILLVANTAKEAAQWLYEHQKIKRARDFRKARRDGEKESKA